MVICVLHATRPIFKFMARTKPTRRISTGGKAPRKQRIIVPKLFSKWNELVTLVNGKREEATLTGQPFTGADDEDDDDIMTIRDVPGKLSPYASQIRARAVLAVVLCVFLLGFCGEVFGIDQSVRCVLAFYVRLCPEATHGSHKLSAGRVNARMASVFVERCLE